MSRHELLDIIADLVEYSACRLDHHGYCQEHTWFEDSECPNARGLQAIGRSYIAEPDTSPYAQLLNDESVVGRRTATEPTDGS